MATYIQTEKRIYRVQALGRIGEHVELQHHSGWFELGKDDGRISGNIQWKWFSTDNEELEGPRLKRRSKKKFARKNNNESEH